MNLNQAQSGGVPQGSAVSPKHIHQQRFHAGFTMAARNRYTLVNLCLLSIVVATVSLNGADAASDAHTGDAAVMQLMIPFGSALWTDDVVRGLAGAILQASFGNM